MADFVFDLYRLNVLDDETLLDFMGKPIRSDKEIREVLQVAAHADFDVTRENPTSRHKWSVRDYVEFEIEGEALGDHVGLTLARSILEKEGRIVTDEGIELGMSEAEPPLASTIQLLFNLRRHLVAVEYNSALMVSDTWLDVLHEVFASASTKLEFRSAVKLMPKPNKEEILDAFRSFRRLTRLRVQLLLPNPELSRYTRKLFEELRDGSIREYLADMRNPQGLSQDEERLPYASAAMAAAGYKEGDVVLEGVRPGSNQKQIVRTGEKPIRGKVADLKEFIRGMGSVARTKETQTAVKAILQEIDRIAEPPDSKSK